MPERSLLSPQARRILLDPPDEALLLDGFATVMPADRPLLATCRSPRTRLELALEILYLRNLGRPLLSGERPSDLLLARVAAQVEATPLDFDPSRSVSRTRRRHFSLAIAHLGLRPFELADVRLVINAARKAADQSDRGDIIVGAQIKVLHAEGVVLPASYILERLGLSARAAARRQALDMIVAGIEPCVRAQLEALLRVDKDLGATRLSWLRQWPQAPSIRNLSGLLDRLSHLREAGLMEMEFSSNATSARRAVIAQEAFLMSAQHMSRLGDNRRLATLCVFVEEIRGQLIDGALHMMDKLLGNLARRAERKKAQRLIDPRLSLPKVLRLHAALGRALVKARTDRADAFAAIDRSVGWENYVATLPVLSEAAGDHDGHLDEVVDHHASVHKIAALILPAFTFLSYRINDPLLAAVQIVREVLTSSGKALPVKVPTGYLRDAWRKYLKVTTKPYKRAYEVAVMVHLRDRLRAGDVWVKGARTYRPFNDFLMTEQVFGAKATDQTTGVCAPLDFDVWLSERTALITRRFDEVAAQVEGGRLVDARIDPKAGLIISPLKSDVPDEALELKARLYARLPRIKITELLAEVDAWTGFTKAFTHVRTGTPDSDKAAILAGVLADATNLGLARMAEASHDLSHSQLLWSAQWHIRPDTYRAASAILTDAQSRHPLAPIWGEENVSSSDGQFFRSGGRGEAGASYNGKYGDRPGNIFYTTLTGRYAPLYSKVIAANGGEAAHMLDGLFLHDAAIAVGEHSTDTAAATDRLFALCHLLGVRFLPRMRNPGDRRLYTLSTVTRPDAFKPLMAGVIATDTIRDNWAEVLRLAATIKSGEAAPSTLLAKLAAYPRQNALARALNEIGKIERTLFLLDWLSDAALRRKVQVILNKGEARNALARAVFFHQLGELRDRTFEDQAFRASGLNLVVAAIILWNTTYLEKAVAEMRARGEVIPDDILAHVAPLGWEHIHLTGDYLWKMVASGILRPLRSTVVHVRRPQNPVEAADAPTQVHGLSG